MKPRDWFRIADAVVRCKLMRYGLGARMPYRLIMNITNMCNSRCVTCGIWKIYADDPKSLRNELRVEEFNKVFRSASDTLWLTLGGGEPFLREDLIDIVSCALSSCKSLLAVDLSTNGLLTDRVEKAVLKILETTSIPHFDVAVSLDGAPHVHERIRGIKGSWKKSVKTYKYLLEIASQFKNFTTHINYTLSSCNVGKLGDFLRSLKNEGMRAKPEDISVSIAHLGLAFSNEELNEEIRIDNPSDEDETLHDIELVRCPLSHSLNSTTVIRTVAKRIFLNLAKTRYLRDTKEMVIPCAAGFASCFVDPYGNVFPCTIWGENMGNLREVNYDLRKILCSDKAKAIRRKIEAGLCPNCWSGCESWQSIAQNIPWVLRFLYAHGNSQ